tara:strand:- start:559 stop:1755 length:1197 start_codon:yes stop_codon:yes gene_type:complete
MEQLELPNITFKFQIPFVDGQEIEILDLIERKKPVFVVACGASKGPVATRAKDLYRSGLFSLSKQVAEQFSEKQFVMSAKNGLIPFEEKVSPYNTKITDLTKNAKLKLTKTISRQIAVIAKETGTPAIIFLGGKAYADILEIACRENSLSLSLPLKGMGLFERTSYLKRILDEYCWAAVQDLIETHLAESPEVFRMRQFSDFPSTKELPENGVYFFLDPTQTPTNTCLPGQVVRIGTHAVSKGSKATLRQRLRAHYGTGDGYGNHRASVFRLHVGASIIHAEKLEELYPHWGDGNVSPKNAPSNERELEQRVSEYIGKLALFAVPIDGESKARNRRSEFERVCISAFSAYLTKHQRLDQTWLGFANPHPTIREAQLWNVNHARDKLVSSDKKVAQIMF